MRRGALAAVYYYATCYAIHQQCKQIELGSTEPCLTDGLLKYKRKWQPQIAPMPSAYSMLIHWPALTESVIQFLADTSMLFVEGDKISAITAIPSREPASADQGDKLFSKQAIAGLRRFWVICESGWQQNGLTKIINQTELKLVQTFCPQIRP